MQTHKKKTKLKRGNKIENGTTYEKTPQREAETYKSINLTDNICIVQCKASRT